MLRYSTVLLLAVMLFPWHVDAVQHSTAPNRKSDILSRSPNAKYHLSCVFHGQRESFGPGDRIDHIEYVTLSDTRTGATVRFRPHDPDSAQSLSFYYKEVWSPDMEWLVLPLGRFEGFQLIRARDALKELRNAKPLDFVRVEMPNGTGLVHEFNGWYASKPNTFGFSVGLSGDNWDFQFNLTDHSASSLVGGDVVTPQGRTTIKGSPGSKPRRDPNLDHRP